MNHGRDCHVWAAPEVNRNDILCERIPRLGWLGGSVQTVGEASLRSDRDVR